MTLFRYISTKSAVTTIDAAFGLWPLESLAPGKVRQDRVNGQGLKAVTRSDVA